jgi:hypothetical protein
LVGNGPGRAKWRICLLEEGKGMAEQWQNRVQLKREINMAMPFPLSVLNIRIQILSMDGKIHNDD